MTEGRVLRGRRGSFPGSPPGISRRSLVPLRKHRGGSERRLAHLPGSQRQGGRGAGRPQGSTPRLGQSSRHDRDPEARENGGGSKREPCSLARAQGLSSDAAGGSAGGGQRAPLNQQSSGSLKLKVLLSQVAVNECERGRYTQAPQLPVHFRWPGLPCFLLLIRQHQNQ